MYLQEVANLIILSLEKDCFAIYNGMKKRCYSFTIDSKLYDALDTYCSENGFNRSMFIEFLLKDFVERQRNKGL